MRWQAGPDLAPAEREVEHRHERPSAFGSGRGRLAAGLADALNQTVGERRLEMQAQQPRPRILRELRVLAEATP